MTHPTAVQLAIEATGAVTPERISRAVSRHICRHCQSPTLRALDGDVLAFDVTVNPDPIDELGELLAIATGRRTYDAITTTGRMELEPRRPAHIPNRRHPVLAEHRCHEPLPTARTRRDETGGVTDEPPF